MTPDRRLSKAARCGSARTGWIGSNPSACRMAELRAPLRSRFNLFQVDTRILTQKKQNFLWFEGTLITFKICSLVWVLTCSTDRAGQGCFAHPELGSQSCTRKMKQHKRGVFWGLIFEISSESPLEILSWAQTPGVWGCFDLNSPVLQEKSALGPRSVPTLNPDYLVLWAVNS